MKKFHMITAANTKYGIGLNNDLPWRLKKDLNHFQNITTNLRFYNNKLNSVIMGRKTFESLPLFLSNRFNIILTNQKESLMKDNFIKKFGEKNIDKVKFISGIREALDFSYNNNDIDQTFIIGGEQIYRKSFENYFDEMDLLFYTRVMNEIECDSFFPKEIFNELELKEISESHSEKNNIFDYTIWQKTNIKNSLFYNNKKTLLYKDKNKIDKFLLNNNNFIFNNQNEEIQYLKLIKEILENGEEKSDRTGTGTFSLFGKYMKFNLRENFPLLTTKRTYWKGVVEELIWFLRGQTDAKILSDKGVHIWDGNGSKEFLESRGFKDRREGDLGPVYGFQWKHFGAEYIDCETKYIDQGYDQINKIIDEIKSNPDSRRLIVSAWNPPALKDMALPPCHVLFQFYVSNGELSCALYQRSADIGLGIPFNIASYSLLTHLIAQICNLKVGNFVHFIGDAHVYSNHKEPLLEQLTRDPYPFPKLKILNKRDKIEDFEFEDFKLLKYKCHKKIPMKMAV